MGAVRRRSGSGSDLRCRVRQSAARGAVPSRRVPALALSGLAADRVVAAAQSLCLAGRDHQLGDVDDAWGGLAANSHRGSRRRPRPQSGDPARFVGDCGVCWGRSVGGLWHRRLSGGQPASVRCSFEPAGEERRVRARRVAVDLSHRSGLDHRAGGRVRRYFPCGAALGRSSSGAGLYHQRPRHGRNHRHSRIVDVSLHSAVQHRSEFEPDRVGCAIQSLHSDGDVLGGGAASAAGLVLYRVVLYADVGQGYNGNHKKRRWTFRVLRKSAALSGAAFATAALKAEAYYVKEKADVVLHLDLRGDGGAVHRVDQRPVVRSRRCIRPQ
ncbi:hypothetical protein PHAMO_210341 [Magnetospirillum molischianum DSM 120]|uniref:Uncharacterized protein n=1 Tax=Magnetospirillum molischianum DSM 120 TaxID=1150626 RepID=H8FR42_MAGML|nr:hypothetical protein PHAMO_210341 [Magnetospirillum molischianum DSM 120]